jgi:hypothetical protein
VYVLGVAAWQSSCAGPGPGQQCYDDAAPLKLQGVLRQDLTWLSLTVRLTAMDEMFMTFVAGGGLGLGLGGGGLGLGEGVGETSEPEPELDKGDGEGEMDMLGLGLASSIGYGDGPTTCAGHCMQGITLRAPFSRVNARHLRTAAVLQLAAPCPQRVSG